MITQRSRPLNPAFDGPDRVLYHGTGRSGTGGTLCSSLSNDCTDVADSPFTCWRHDLGVEVTCRTTSPFGFACDSPTVGSFTCTEPESPINSFTCL